MTVTRISRRTRLLAIFFCVSSLPLARPDLDRLEPTTTIDSKTFDQRGYLDVGQALSELPAFGVQPSSAANNPVQLIVNNLFDKQPPYPALAGTGGNFVEATTQYFQGILGGNLLLSADYKF